MPIVSTTAPLVAPASTLTAQQAASDLTNAITALGYKADIKVTGNDLSIESFWAFPAGYLMPYGSSEAQGAKRVTMSLIDRAARDQVAAKLFDGSPSLQDLANAAKTPVYRGFNVVSFASAPIVNSAVPTDPHSRGYANDPRGITAVNNGWAKADIYEHGGAVDADGWYWAAASRTRSGW